MAKREYTEYICDRCGEQITNAKHWIIGHHKFMHVFKWFVPLPCEYKLLYLCPDCYRLFRKWAFLSEEE